MTLYNKRVHVLNPHGIGDVIMMIPLLQSILNYRPSHLSITVKGHIEADVVKMLLPSTDIHFISMNDYQKYRISGLRLFFYLMKLRRMKPDIVLTAFGTSVIQSSIAAFLSGAPIRLSWKGKLSFLNTHTLVPLPSQHKVFQHLATVDAITSSNHAFEAIRFQSEKSVTQRVQGILKGKGVAFESENLVAFAPGSGIIEAHKRWPAGKVAQLIDQLVASDHGVPILLGTEIESNLGERILSLAQYSDKVINLIGKLSIRETAHLLHLCQFAVCNCNGLAHLAGAVGTYVIALYGPTDASLTRPFTRNLSVISRNLKCSPCYRKRYIQGCGNPICLTELPVELVFQEIRGRFSKSPI